MGDKEFMRYVERLVDILHVRTLFYQAEIEAYNKTLKEFMNENPDLFYDPQKYAVKVIPPELAYYYADAKSGVNTGPIKVYNNRADGSIAMVAPIENASVLDKIERNAINMATSFTVDINELAAKQPNNKIITTGTDLTHAQIYTLLPKLTKQNIPYCLNDDHSISFFETDRSKINKAITEAAAKLSAPSYLIAGKEFEKAATAINKIKNRAKSLKDDEAIYISSSEKQTKNNGPAYFLKVEKNNVTSVCIKNDNSKTEVIQKELGPKEIEKLTIGLMHPVMLEENEFNERSYSDTIKNYENKLNKTYSSVLSGEQHIDKKETITTEFMSEYGSQMYILSGKDGSKINLVKAREPEEILKMCADFVKFKNDEAETTNDKEIKKEVKEINKKWDAIKDDEKLLGRFNSFLNIKDTLKNAFDNAEEKTPQPPER